MRERFCLETVAKVSHTAGKPPRCVFVYTRVQMRVPCIPKPALIVGSTEVMGCSVKGAVCGEARRYVRK